MSLLEDGEFDSSHYKNIAKNSNPKLTTFIVFTKASLYKL